jgi:hypothetical protein
MHNAGAIFGTLVASAAVFAVACGVGYVCFLRK